MPSRRPLALRVLVCNWCSDACGGVGFVRVAPAYVLLTITLHVMWQATYLGTLLDQDVTDLPVAARGPARCGWRRTIYRGILERMGRYRAVLHGKYCGRHPSLEAAAQAVLAKFADINLTRDALLLANARPRHHAQAKVRPAAALAKVRLRLGMKTPPLGGDLLCSIRLAPHRCRAKLIHRHRA